MASLYDTATFLNATLEYLYDTVSKWHSLFMTQSLNDTVSKWHSIYMTQSLYDTVSIWHSLYMTQIKGVPIWHSVFVTQYLYDTVSQWHSLDMPQCLNVSIWHSLHCYAWGISRLCHKETVSFRTVSYRDCVIKRLCHYDM